MIRRVLVLVPILAAFAVPPWRWSTGSINLTAGWHFIANAPPVYGGGEGLAASVDTALWAVQLLAAGLVAGVLLVPQRRAE